tara:strand:+ start:358 stop:768 length:411 start_codon:yes stop_codon:yes gene_type:complete
VSIGGDVIFELFEIFSHLLTLFILALVEVIPEESTMLIPSSEVAVTAEDFTTIKIIPVLIPRTENECFTEVTAVTAHDCGHHVGFGVDSIGGEVPDRLVDAPIIIGVVPFTSADEFDVVEISHDGILLRMGGGCQA